MRVLFLLAFLPGSLLANTATEHELDWLIGCWITMDGKSQEVWVLDSDNSLAGFAVSIHDNSVRFYEVLTIKRDEAGLLLYTAHPSGQATTTFVAMEIADNNVLFVNADHDYPQAIRYVRDGNQLAAKISMLDGSRENSFYKVACE